METESLSDADRIAGNADALDKVESEIVLLEQMFAGLESLKTEKDRLTAAVQNLHKEEAQILSDGASSESSVVKKLIETRARIDVQSARLTSTQNKIKEQTAGLSIQGENVRKVFARIVAQLWLSRQARTVAILTELFGGPIRLQSGRMELKELTRHTSLMKQLKDVDNRVSHPISDPEQEEIALRQRVRLWLAELTDLVTNEPGLALTSLPGRQQPSEQPREFITA